MMACIVCLDTNLYCETQQREDCPLVEKLKDCIPEIEWCKKDQLCMKCVAQVNSFYSFKRECITSYFHNKKKLKQLLQVKSIEEEENSDNSNNSFSTKDYNQSSNADFTNHESEDQDPSVCYQYNQQFENSTVLETHLLTEHLKSSDIKLKSNSLCPNAENIEVNPEDTKIREKQPKEGRTPVRKYSCEVCGEFFKFARNVVDHAIREHDMQEKTIKPYSCEICNMRFACCANLLQHKKYHDKIRTLICSICGKSFITRSDLIIHEHTHYNLRKYKCKHCDKAFNTNKTLRSHNLVCHTNSELWKYSCTICEKRFALKSGHDQHIKRHIGDKKHTCHICSKSFVSPSELKKHILFHSNVRDYKCESCGKEYKANKVYQIHLAKVHGIGDAKIPVRAKKYACYFCGNMFPDKAKLERHLCTHTGLKPFPCDICDKRFTEKYAVKHHKRVAHGITQLEDS